MFRLVTGAVKFLFTLVVIAAIAAGYLFYRAMPSYSGDEKLPGLSADVRVWRDEHAIPHIFAANMRDASRALGYLHASERLYQMEVSRRVGQGRIAEIGGAEVVGVDKFIRTLGLYRLAQSSYAALSDEARARLDAYAEGVNAFYFHAPERVAGRIPVDRRDAGALEACRFAGLAEADGVAVEPQPRPGNRAFRTRRQAAAGAGQLADAELFGERPDHHDAGDPRQSRRARRP